jgi:hypothetical protein
MTLVLGVEVVEVEVVVEVQLLLGGHLLEKGVVGEEELQQLLEMEEG